MILTNDSKFNEWARPMIYDGRHKTKMYTEDEFECIGWHMYMTPEQAYIGLKLLEKFKDIQPNRASYKEYKSIRKYHKLYKI